MKEKQISEKDEEAIRKRIEVLMDHTMRETQRLLNKLGQEIFKYVDAKEDKEVKDER